MTDTIVGLKKYTQFGKKGKIDHGAEKDRREKAENKDCRQL